jgi:hypothetical protein
MAPVLALLTALALALVLAPSGAPKTGAMLWSSSGASAASPLGYERCGSRADGELHSHAAAEAYTAADGDLAAVARVLGCLRELHPARVS